MAMKVFRFVYQYHHLNQTNRLLNFSRLNKFQRNIHCNITLHKKMFLEHENQFAYSVMMNKGYAAKFPVMPKSTNTTVTKDQFEKILQEDWIKKSPSAIFDAFSKLSWYGNENNLCISNKIFDSFIDNLTDNIKLATDDELQTLFYYLLQWPETESIRTRNYIEVWAALDDECLSRLKRWSYDEMLNFISLFYLLNVTKPSDYCTKCLQKLASKSKQLTPYQLVQVIFYVGILRKAPYDMHSLEICLNQHFELFSIDELAIMSMGFFKSKTPIRNMELISRITDKIIAESKDINEISLSALLKIVRYSNKASISNKVYKVLDVLQHEIPRLSMMCNIHVALLGTTTLTLHKECLNKIAVATINNIDQTRLKDLERLVLTYGTFNFVPDTTTCLFQKVLEELRKPQRIPEIEKHGKCFACCVSYLALLGIFPIDLMNKVLSPQFLEKTYGKQYMTYGREILTIHNSSKIFCPEAEMHRLSDKCAILLAKKYTDYVPSETYIKQYNISEKMMIDIIKVLKEFRGGEEYVTGDHIVTHHQRGDIILCNNHDGQPMNVQKYFSSAKFGFIHKVPDDNIWIVLVVAGKNAMIENFNIPTGAFQMKITELKKLGYHAALVLWSEYSKLETKEAKADYLNNLIKDAINETIELKVKMM